MDAFRLQKETLVNLEKTKVAVQPTSRVAAAFIKGTEMFLDS